MLTAVKVVACLMGASFAIGVGYPIWNPIVQDIALRRWLKRAEKGEA